MRSILLPGVALLLASPVLSEGVTFDDVAAGMGVDNTDVGTFFGAGK